MGENGDWSDFQQWVVVMVVVVGVVCVDIIVVH